MHPIDDMTTDTQVKPISAGLSDPAQGAAVPSTVDQLLEQVRCASSWSPLQI
jgi:hypothetical protein